MGKITIVLDAPDEIDPSIIEEVFKLKVGKGKFEDKLKEIEQIAIKQMSELNKVASETMRNHDVNACTDVTGFGLLGHLREVLRGSNKSAVINYNSVPFIDGIYDLALAGSIPGGTKNNLKYVGDFMTWGSEISELQKFILADAQTSGGLLIFIPEEKSKALLDDLHKAGIEKAAIIGKIVENEINTIFVEN